MTTEKAVVAIGGRGISPRDLEGAFRLAEAIHQSGLAPYGLDSAQKVLVAALTGMDLGLPYMVALRAIHVIEGTPCVNMKAVRALITASGKADKPLIAEFTGEGDDYCCTVSTTRSGELVTGTYSVGDAKRAGLWNSKTKYGKPTNWILRPDRMMQARATGNLGNDHFGDVLHGIAFDEEVRDIAAMADAETVPTPQAEDPLLIEALAADEPQGFVEELAATPLQENPLVDEEEDRNEPAVDPEPAEDPSPEEIAADEQERQEWISVMPDRLSKLANDRERKDTIKKYLGGNFETATLEQLIECGKLLENL